MYTKHFFLTICSSCGIQVFSGTTEGKSSTETTVQRTNRRISYVMATSSPSSPRHEASLETTKEEEVKTLCSTSKAWSFIFPVFVLEIGGTVHQDDIASSETRRNLGRASSLNNWWDNNKFSDVVVFAGKQREEWASSWHVRSKCFLLVHNYVYVFSTVNLI